MMERKTIASQRTISNRLVTILNHYDFDNDHVTCRCKDKSSKNQSFYPDIVARKNKCKFVYEIEATVNNNTIFKSISSLMKFIRENSNNGITIKAFLVVPSCSVSHAKKCLGTTRDLLSYFSNDNFVTIKLSKMQIVNFDRVSFVYDHVKRRQLGRKLKCEFV